ELEVGSLGGPIPPELAPRAIALLAAVVEPVRVAHGRLLVTSGYRPGDGGQHGRAEAVDVRPLDADRADVWAWLLIAARHGLPVDQAILYEDTRHLHLSHTTQRKNRGDFLVALAARRPDG